MSEFVFNDIYGSEQVKQKYTKNFQYTYYNAVLKMHNKFYENSEMHQSIFNPRKVSYPNKSLDLDRNGTKYRIQRLNRTTYRINKNNNKNSHEIKTRKYKLPDVSPNNNTISFESQRERRNLVTEANMLKNLLQLKSLDRKSPKNIKQMQKMSKTINKSLYKEKRSIPH